MSTVTHLYEAGADAQQIYSITKQLCFKLQMNQLCLITSAQHLIDRREILRKFYQAHLYLLQQKQWNHGQPQRCQP